MKKFFVLEECEDCEGTGFVVTRHPGSSVPGRRWDCDTCRTTGYVEPDEPIEVEKVGQVRPHGPIMWQQRR